jgi:hypothetical protein
MMRLEVRDDVPEKGRETVEVRDDVPEMMNGDS